MKDINLIGLSGRAETGKSFICENYLVPKGFVNFSLAAHFKIWIAAKGEATYEEVFYTKPPHVRKLLQEEGTERGRNVYGEQIWVNCTLEWMRFLKETSQLTRFVISDCRFPNEVEAIQNAGGKVYRIIAPHRAAQSKLSAEARQHPSETALDNYTNFDGFIHNDPGDEMLIESQLKDLIKGF